MKNKYFALLLSIVLLAALLLSSCGGSEPEPTAAPEQPAAEAEAPAAEAETPAEEEAPMAEEAEAPAEEAEAAEEEAAEAPAEEESPAVAEGPLPAIITMPNQIAGGNPVEITVIGMPAESQPEALAAWEEQVGRFTAMYPNVTIVGTDYAYAPDSFAALVAGNQVPTLFEVYLTDPGKMIDQGIPADLTPIFEEQNLDDVFNPEILGITSQDGKIYGIPRFAYAMGLAYNIQMLKDAGFDAPPTSWDELAVISQELTDRDNGVAGFSFITDGSGAAGWHMTTIAYNFGLKNTDIVAADDNGGYTAGFGNAAMQEALSFVYDLRWQYDVLPRENLDWPRNGEALATERAAMVVMAGDQYTWIRQTFADVDINKFGFAPLPAGPNGKSTSLVGGNIAMVSSSATADQVEAAVYWRLFTQFDPNEILANYEAGVADPTVVVGAPVLPLYVGEYQTALQALEAQYANLPVENYALFLDAISSGLASMQPEPLVAGQEYYGAMGSVVSIIVADESADPTSTLQEAVDTFQVNVLDLLAH